MKRLWCYFACSPHQADFGIIISNFLILVEMGNLTTMIVDGFPKVLRIVNLTMNKVTNCDLFKSCKKTKYATQVTAMGNAIGFTTFQVFNINNVVN